MLKKGVGDIEDVLERNTKCINRGLCRLRAKLEENTQNFVPQTTEEDEEYIDDYSSEKEMEHLYNSPPITIMALGEEYNSEEATERPATFVCHHHLDPEQQPRSWISKRISSYTECQVKIGPQEDFCNCVK